MSDKIKNMNQETVLSLADLVDVKEGQVVSRTLSQNDHVSLTLFAFAKGEEISTHSSEGDALITIFMGKARITIDGTAYELTEGQSILMPATKPHAVFALEEFKMSLTVVF